MKFITRLIEIVSYMATIRKMDKLLAIESVDIITPKQYEILTIALAKYAAVKYDWMPDIRLSYNTQQLMCRHAHMLLWGFNEAVASLSSPESPSDTEQAQPPAKVFDFKTRKLSRFIRSGR